MIRGTTPVLRFVLPFGTDLLAEAWITLCQNKKEVLTKELPDCTCEENEISVRLTQEETLKLNSSYKTQIQLRIKTKAGEALASDKYDVQTDDVLKDGVI